MNRKSNRSFTGGVRAVKIARFSPSPRPSPLGRGRSAFRVRESLMRCGSLQRFFANNRSADTARQAFVQPVSAACCSLSLRERVRVRRYATQSHPTAGLLSCSPSPRPSPLGRGRNRFRARETSERLDLSHRFSTKSQNVGRVSRTHELSASADCCSLSLRERVRVRGKSASEVSQTMVLTGGLNP